MPWDPKAVKPFGTMRDGRAVEAFRLSWPDGIEAEVLTYGAVVRTLRYMGVETVLGFETLAEYEADGASQGRVVGRCANRIDGARFEIDGEPFATEANEGASTLHGGAAGFGRRLWRPVAADQRSLTLEYVSPDGEEGFPGTLRTEVAFRLEGPETLTIAWMAKTDRPTPVNLTHHLYFNLSGEPERSALGHRLKIAAGAITPVRHDLIPTGGLLPVEGTPFDLREGRVLADALAEAHPQMMFGGFDHNWVLDGRAGPAAVLSSPETNLALEITTDQPGLQVYTGQGLDAPFAPFGGIALEPQAFPNAVNTPAFPAVVLRPGEAYRRHATYRFAAGAPDTIP